MTIAFPDQVTDLEREAGAVLSPRFDANGLVTAVTIDATTGDVLMVAHMNAEALSLSIETGFAHYFSRSRGRLWKKGEASGELQKIVDIRTDCDQDAFILTVKQLGRGAACHTGRRSCFYRRVEAEGELVRLTDTGDAQLFDPAKVY